MKTQAVRTPQLITLFACGCFAFYSVAQAVNPPPDGGYPGGNTAEGTSALFSLNGGFYNTAVGIYSLLSLTDGSFNTAIGAGTLLLNTATENTATGAGALLSNVGVARTRRQEHSHFLTTPVQPAPRTQLEFSLAASTQPLVTERSLAISMVTRIQPMVLVRLWQILRVMTTQP